MIRSFVFSQKEGRLISQDIGYDLLAVLLKDEGVQFWVDIGEASDEEALAILDNVFHFHPLAIEDCLAPSDRPKVDEYEDHIFLVIHSVELDEKQRDFNANELDMFVGQNFLVTYHRKPLKSIAMTMEKIAKNPHSLARAPDRLVYTILDFLLDNYTPLVSHFSQRIADVEANVLERGSDEIFDEIMRLKSLILKLTQICWPQREMLTRLARGEVKLIRPHMLPYYRDLLDQLVRITTQAETYRNALTDIMQVHLNLQQTQINRIIKVLTVLATLSMPILIITSFYGMNFQHWPTLDHSTLEAYLWVFGVTAVMTVGLYWFMRRKGWW